MATKSERIEFVKAVYPAAKALWEKQDSIHPVFVTAQAALETGWRIRGASNNIFGITKGSSWTGLTALELTTENFPVPDKRFYASGEGRIGDGGLAGQMEVSRVPAVQGVRFAGGMPLRPSGGFTQIGLCGCVPVPE
jgi:hypothetical protein